MRAATVCGPVHMTGGLLLVLVLPVVSLQIIVAGNYGNGSVHARQVAYQTKAARIRIRGYGNFSNNPIRGYVFNYFINK